MQALCMDGSLSAGEERVGSHKRQTRMLWKITEPTSCAPTSFLPPLFFFPLPGLAGKLLQGCLGEAASSLRGHAVHHGQHSAREQSTGGELGNPVKTTLFHEPFVKEI